MKLAEIQIELKTFDLLNQLANENNLSIGELIDKMAFDFQKKSFWNKVNEAFANLKADEFAWQEELAERSLWENTLSDGLLN